MAAPGHLIGGTSINVDSTSLMSTDTSIFIAIDTTTMINGEETRVAGSYTVWQAIVTSATSIGSMVLRYGTDQNYSAGASTRVYILPTSSRENRLVDGLLEEHKQTGAHSDINADSVTSTDATFTNATITNLTVGSQTPSADWTAIGTAPDTVTYNGQRSYNLVFNDVDYTNILSPGQRLKTTRTVAAPTQCTSLNGSTQYWNKTSPNKLTFTDDFVVDAYVKLTSYAADNIIVSRLGAASGWVLNANSAGQIVLTGYNTGYANFSKVTSYQSIPINKWVRVTAQLDMSTFTATTTTSYVMIDGVDVPASVTRGGTNPTALVQQGDLNIGAQNGGVFFPGKIAQVAIYNAKVTQANIRLTHSQGLAGTETSLASAYSFDGVATDLNTTTPNDLTAQGAAGYAADSPFGTQASGLISSTLDYGIVQSAVFSTNTTVVVQVPEGCTIPTSGGVSAVSYSGLKAPYGFPDQNERWSILTHNMSDTARPTPGANTWYNDGGVLSIPIGSWKIYYGGCIGNNINATQGYAVKGTLSTANNTSGGADIMIGGQTQTFLNAIVVSSVTAYREFSRSFSSSTPMYFNILSTGATTNMYLYGTLSTTLIQATNAYL
jgi:hypothetical protein